MFVLTCKLNKKRALLIIVAAAVILAVLAIALGSPEKDAAAPRVRNNADRVKYLHSLGWEVETEPVSEKKVIIPQEFSGVYESYNEMQIAQGFDLRKYRGLEVTIYTYNVTNYRGYTGSVVADLYVLNFEVAGGDVRSLALDGFMHGLRR